MALCAKNNGSTYPGACVLVLSGSLAMKQRTTFIVSDPIGTHPEKFSLTSGALNIKSLPLSTVREDRFTLGFHELPSEIWGVLKQCQEVWLRWASGRGYQSVDPYSSRIPAGLHLFLSPIKGTTSYLPPALYGTSLADEQPVIHFADY